MTSHWAWWRLESPAPRLFTVYLGADQRKHQSSASLAFVRGIHRWPVNSPHKGPVTRKMFPFDDVIILRTFAQLEGFGDKDRTWIIFHNIIWGWNYQSMPWMHHCTMVFNPISIVWYFCNSYSDYFERDSILGRYGKEQSDMLHKYMQLCDRYTILWLPVTPISCLL